MNEELEAQAFEYVMGTLRGFERERFEKHLEKSSTLQECVNFWEEKLAVMNEDEPAISPNPSVWDAIDVQLKHSLEHPVSKPTNDWLLRWLLPLALSFFIALTFLFNTGQHAHTPGYVAVLTDNAGQALLTAITVEAGAVITLQWEEQPSAADSVDYQLWASSKRDQQVRSLLVLSRTDNSKIRLSEAQWRLIQDASSLLLTQEEKGGSPINEPSDIVLAQGPCVRFSNSETDSGS